MLELERLGVRVVSGRSGRGGNGDDDEEGDGTDGDDDSGSGGHGGGGGDENRGTNNKMTMGSGDIMTMMGGGRGVRSISCILFMNLESDSAQNCPSTSRPNPASAKLFQMGNVGGMGNMGMVR